MKNNPFLGFYVLMNQIVVTFSEPFNSELYVWMDLWWRASLSQGAPYSAGTLLQGKIKVCGKFQRLREIFASFSCSPSPNFAELLCYSINELSLRFLPIRGFPGVTNCADLLPFQAELLPSLPSYLLAVLASSHWCLAAGAFQGLGCCLWIIRCLFRGQEVKDRRSCVMQVGC